MTTVREASFAIFRHFGVDALFGNPGSTELPMLRGMPADIPYVLGLSEAVVLGMADGYAQATRRPSLVNLHSSAGTGNALGNLYTAYRNNTPIVVTAGQQARSILPFDPFLGAERPTEFPRPFVKWACEPARAEDVPLALVRAFHIAMTPPMGPTFVSVPVDDWDRECEMPDLPALALTVQPPAKGIARLAAMLDSASKPALVIGAGVARSGGWQAAIDLVERSQADVWCAPLASRETFPESHPRFAGFLPAFREEIVKLLAPYDAILVAGTQAFTYHAEGHGPHVPEGATLGLLSDDPQHLSFQPGGIGVLGDVGDGLRALAKAVTEKPAREAQPRATAPEAAMTAAYALHRIAELRPDNAMLTEEAPTARGAMHDHLPITCEQGFFATASGGIGYALPAAVGLARGAAQRKVIALIGDGSAMYSISGLWSAAEQGSDISFVILNNSRYAALESFGQVFGMNHVPGTDISGIDFVTLAESMGVPARRSDDVATLDEALEWSFGTKGPTLVELVIA
ncbi:benzoylformate decarboxylase [Parerythrobacter aestuarii]|uniref:benzoylformate decarboxylase n=1 Tax=Parerythrobacter aestuarii TaxID=3020909 RepID=UPI0024DF021F|nr:benzoylformate decarboxylase [Parerythrobacter aestuarii]